MPTITSVWSAYGHRFISEDDHESCLTCGAVYDLVPTPDGPSDGAYVNVRGDAPMECSRDTGMAHGYPGERYCHEHQHPRDYSDHECEHVRHDCNCLLCDS